LLTLLIYSVKTYVSILYSILITESGHSEMNLKLTDINES